MTHVTLHETRRAYHRYENDIVKSTRKADCVRERFGLNKAWIEKSYIRLTLFKFDERDAAWQQKRAKTAKDKIEEFHNAW